MQFPAISQSPKDAARAVQHFLNVLDPSRPTAVDGIIGRNTRAVYGGLPSSLKEAVESLAKARNPLVLSQLANDQPRSDSRRRISHDEAVGLAHLAIAKHGKIPVTGATSLELMEFLLSLEPLGNKRDGYVVESVSPSKQHIGIYQMGEPAWIDVNTSGRMDRSLTWRTTCFDPALASEAAVIYLQIVARQLRGTHYDAERSRRLPPYTGPLTKEVLYGAYNQGAGGFKMGAKWLKDQSPKGQQVILAGLAAAGIPVRA